MGPSSRVWQSEGHGVDASPLAGRCAVAVGTASLDLPAQSVTAYVLRAEARVDTDGTGAERCRLVNLVA
ncbi:hypothetical protein [Micromonospora sp. KC721]|uniref:hypothetical protein n=1 Tax=Micromonospora sp. KC721 TaxID=2530380 RepID=UPI001044B2CD|nr:hypothetical protein [Micromonospora sp. KC721]TDB82781.1 hypothetical protein E1182_00325 [Micromonospora sp. KC721]